MVTIVIVENGAEQEALLSIVKSALAVKNAETLLIASNPIPELGQTRNFIPSSHAAISSCVQQAVNRAKSSVMVFVDARFAPNAADLEALLREVQAGSHNRFVSMPIAFDGEASFIGELSPETMVATIASSPTWPLALAAVSRKSLQSLGEISGDSLTEILVKAMIRCVAQGDEMIESDARLAAPTAASQAVLKLSDEALARCLNTAVNSCNIEDLFPGHAWGSHGEESAAASYHTLAAIFIRLGDMESATACLSFSDQFEDSPRSLALKGIIAQKKGEILGAVANMVSSLQQYEARKAASAEPHYLNFKPQDLEVINTNLQAGLEALNKRDNEKALGHFSLAVCNFDSLYSECGLSSAK